MCQVRFSEITCHLGQQFVAGDSNVDSKAEFFSDTIPDLLCQGQRPLPVIRPDPLCQIQKGFIDRHLLQERCVLRKEIHQRMRISSIGLKIRPDQHQMGTFLQRLDHRFSCLYSVFFCRNGFGSDDPVACLYIPSHCGRNGAQIYRSGFFLQLLESRPG